MGSSTQAPWISDYDLYLLAEGTNCRAYEKMGAHLGESAGQLGVHFVVWKQSPFHCMVGHTR
jgi:1,4-alpha-glucan branching enzyme